MYGVHILRNYIYVDTPWERSVEVSSQSTGLYRKSTNFVIIKVPPSGEYRSQRTERQVICKAPAGQPWLSIRRLENHITFNQFSDRETMNKFQNWGISGFRCLRTYIFTKSRPSVYLEISTCIHIYLNVTKSNYRSPNVAIEDFIFYKLT